VSPKVAVHLYPLLKNCLKEICASELDQAAVNYTGKWTLQVVDYASSWTLDLEHNVQDGTLSGNLAGGGKVSLLVFAL